MERERYKKLFLIIYILILVLSLIFLFLNLDTISVIHAGTDMLPVLVYETYSSLELSLFYILILITLFNIFLIWSKKLEPYSLQIISLTSIIAIIVILLFLLNPHSIILFPAGYPPTALDYLNIGALATISLFGAFTLVTFTYLYTEGKLLKYFIFAAIILGGLLVSEFIHEGGHAIFGLISGGTITEFYPFPVLLGREFTAGYVGFDNVPSQLIPLVLMGGEIFQWITIAIIGLILWRIKPTGKTRLFLLLLLLIAWLDFPLYVINNSIGIPHWFLIGSTQGDIILFCNKTGFPLYIMIIFACIQLVLGIFIILKIKFGGGNRK